MFFRRSFQIRSPENGANTFSIHRANKKWTQLVIFWKFISIQYHDKSQNKSGILNLIPSKHCIWHLRFSFQSTMTRDFSHMMQSIKRLECTVNETQVRGPTAEQTKYPNLIMLPRLDNHNLKCSSVSLKHK